MTAMDDKTMLELAARAAGVEFDGYDEEQNCLFKNHQTSYGPGKSFWGPLNYEADTFRLAQKLGLVVDFKLSLAAQGGLDDAETDWVGGDSCPCRAIVRAAAEIGKAMGRG